ncbi:glycosyltransferase family 2 protein [Streptomyces ipomoeae]|uniref:glycosyltransferase family 2 protein n=1 Tax=Streptomyces ipomoeae TaxID=103232 RepID=UPI00114631C9|nr:glycosyltransferase family 2 protein [Streptomyces ipomoeae]MDX2933471.1 glycosyltransferase [Streptomyces ipomoeae]TQE21569.1 glycosyltransferase [Streptomyces ipomoeae]
MRHSEPAGGRADLRQVERYLARISNGNVIRVTETGPVFGSPSPVRTVGTATFVPALLRRDRFLLVVIALCWAASLAWFWSWWLEPQHRATWAGLLINSALLLYLTALPAYFFVTVLRARRVNPALPVPQVRVALAVTRAPSEPWATVRRTLEAMLAQDYPHPYDVWLCEEAPTEETTRWCRARGVHLSSRRGVTDYHRPYWPRRTRCKEGNFAYFYDHWGYGRYDVVAQLDCDHVPAPSYLAEMVRPFADPAIGYVAAPSMCDTNAGLSWAARGRLHREAVSHGAFQLGHCQGLAPMCIGSHYAVRTRALRDIGGLGPELAEDFSTTFLLNSAGWQGAFAIDAEAHGDGPLTFTDMVTQEYQWSRSLTAMLVDLLPHHLHRLPLLLRLRFSYALTYYPLLGLTVAAGLMLPPVAVVCGLPWMRLDYFRFLLHLWPMVPWPMLGWLLLRRRGLLRPPDSPLVSWEGWLFSLTRWPFVAWGVLGALAQHLRPRPTTFKVTPKGTEGPRPLHARLVIPFAALSAGLSAVALYGEQTGPYAGYVFLCLLAATTYAVVTVAIPLLHLRETARTTDLPLTAVLPAARAPLAIALVSVLATAAAVVLYPQYAAAVLGW